jgi:hypothetical protein
LLHGANAPRNLKTPPEKTPQFILRSLDDYLNFRSIAIRKNSVHCVSDGNLALGNLGFHENFLRHA